LDKFSKRGKKSMQGWYEKKQRRGGSRKEGKEEVSKDREKGEERICGVKEQERRWEVEGGWDEGGRRKEGNEVIQFRLYSLMKQLLPSEEIFEDYLHPTLFWGIFVSYRGAAPVNFVWKHLFSPISLPLPLPRLSLPLIVFRPWRRQKDAVRYLDPEI
jgi:hypothetical protein